MIAIVGPDALAYIWSYFEEDSICQIRHEQFLVPLDEFKYITDFFISKKIDRGDYSHLLESLIFDFWAGLYICSFVMENLWKLCPQRV